jgi:manganese transport protein
MEGFLEWRMKPWVRRLVTRSATIVPALLVVICFGESGMGWLLMLSQVILSFQLPFAVVPLICYTSRGTMMGAFVNPRWLTMLASAIAVLIIALNLTMLFNHSRGLSS